jgi:hypothetical protein
MTILFSTNNFLSLYYTINNNSNKYHRMIRAIIYLIINKGEDKNLITLSLYNLYKHLINGNELINFKQFIYDKQLEFNITNLNKHYSNLIIYEILTKIYNNT